MVHVAGGADASWPCKKCCVISVQRLLIRSYDRRRVRKTLAMAGAASHHQHESRRDKVLRVLIFLYGGNLEERFVSRCIDRAESSSHSTSALHILRAAIHPSIHPSGEGKPCPCRKKSRCWRKKETDWPRDNNEAEAIKV